jgi:hypothetical protein
MSFVIRDDVPILDEHVVTDEDGKTLAEIDGGKLALIAHRANRRIAETGDEVPIVIGHTRDDAPESEQPEIVGYASNFRVGNLFRTGRKAIKATFKFFRDKIGLVRKYPRRSVELWLSDWTIDPISLLGATTPERDLGLLKMSKRNGKNQKSVRLRSPEKPRKYQAASAVPDPSQPNELVAQILAALEQSDVFQWIRQRMKEESAKAQAGQGEQEPEIAEESEESEESGLEVQTPEIAGQEMPGATPDEMPEEVPEEMPGEADMGLDFLGSDEDEEDLSEDLWAGEDQDPFLNDDGLEEEPEYRSQDNFCPHCGQAMQDSDDDLEEAEISDLPDEAEEDTEVEDFDFEDEDADEEDFEDDDEDDEDDEDDDGEDADDEDEDEDDEDEDEPIRYECGYPGASNTYTPKMNKTKHPKKAQKKPARQQFQRAGASPSERIRFARLEQELNKMRQVNAALVRKYARSEREKDLIQLEAEGYELDRNEELDFVENLDDSSYQAHLNRIRRRYSRSPVHGGVFQMASVTRAPAQDGRRDKNRMREIAEFAAANGISYQQAVEQLDGESI